MVDGAFCLSENICLEPARLRRFAAWAEDEHHRIHGLSRTSHTRRGMRHGMLSGSVAGTCLAHAASLPYDVFVGTGPARLPQTLAYQRAQFAGAHTIAHDPCVVYGAPRGLAGPLLAAMVGFLAGTSKVLGMALGVACGFVTSPMLLLYGGHSADFKAHIAHHKQLGGNYGLRTGHAVASLSAALVSDVVRIPSVATKLVCPAVGLVLGACVGSIYGLKETWPGDTSAWVAHCGEGASAMSQQGIVLALEMTYLWCLRQARLGP